MVVTLHDFVHAAGHGDDGIAGYLESGAGSPGASHRFVHWRSSNAMLPAFVPCLEGGGDMRRVYTNHESAPWARPRGPGVKRRDNLRADAGDGALAIEPVEMTERRWPARVSVRGGPAPLPGGLHAAARAIVASAGAGGTGGSETGASEADTSETGTSATDAAATGEGATGEVDEIASDDDAAGLRRALGYYALATRTLVAHSAASGFRGVHDHVGALLVGDDGAILAAGINTGSYRHAEVSLLLSWFRDHPEARTLPGKSIVFSTLTPCRQCTRYLSLAKAEDTVILFDEPDTGRAGRIGERIATRFDMGIDRTAGAPASSSPPELAPRAIREAERRAARNGGGDGTSRIDLAREARRRILEAAEAAEAAGTANAATPARPSDRTPSRATGPDRANGAEGREAERAVVAYLARWIRGAVLVA